MNHRSLLSFGACIAGGSALGALVGAALAIAALGVYVLCSLSASDWDLDGGGMAVIFIGMLAAIVAALVAVVGAAVGAVLGAAGGAVIALVARRKHQVNA